MDLDDDICLCFHVSKRKVINFIRVQKPRRAAQISECFGAGTGCGWCRTYLRQLFEAATSQRADAKQRELDSSAFPSAQQYAEMRKSYVRSGKGTPPEVPPAE